MQIKKTVLVLGAIVGVGASAIAGLGAVAAAMSDTNTTTAPSAGSSSVDGQQSGPVDMPSEPTGQIHHVVGGSMDATGGVTSGSVSDSGN